MQTGLPSASLPPASSPFAGQRRAGHTGGHPFRRALSVRVTAMPVAPKSREDDKDWKLFLLSFAAFFTVFYSFIA
jgi:hypothetical protein